MSYDRVRVPPNPRYVAEVLVLRSSLGAKRRELNAGRAVLGLLEVKRVHCKVIDLNTDARAGFEDGENEALQKLKDLGRLNKEGEGDLALPLVFIDGWRVGNNYDLQNLEDNGVLGRILRRELCVNCYEKKDKDMMNCFACKTKYAQIIVDNKDIAAILSDYYERPYTSGDMQEEDNCSEGDSDLRYMEFEEERNKQKPKPPPAVPKDRPKFAPRKSVSKAFSEKRAMFEGKAASGRKLSVAASGRKLSVALPPIISIIPAPQHEEPLLPALMEVPEEPEEDPAEPDPPRLVLSVHDFLAEHEGSFLPGEEQEEDDDDDWRSAEVRTFAVNQDGPSSLEMARRMVLQSIVKRKQVLKPVATRFAARAGSDLPLADFEELPMLSGHMWKKSPNPYRLRSFQWRFFVIKDAQVIWWRYREEADQGGSLSGDGKALCNGFINLRAGPVEVLKDPENDTTFSLRPLGGIWQDGAIGKGDTNKSFTFDTSQSEHSRRRWARDIAEHVRRLHGP